MPKAINVAIELHKLADAIEKLGDQEMSSPFVYFSHASSENSESFVALGKVLPRPLKKDYGIGNYPDFQLKFRNDNISITSSIPRSSVCEMIEPARPAQFNCPSIFSDEEEKEMGDF